MRRQSGMQSERRAQPPDPERSGGGAQARVHLSETRDHASREIPAEVGGLTGAPPGAHDAGWLTHPLKRWMDVAVAGPCLLLALPVMGLISIAIRIDSPGPVIFRQVRIGRGGRPFQMLKFRTMDEGAEEVQRMGIPGDLETEAAWRKYQKLLDDPRVTRVGRLLRRWSLDEIPQLWNVLRGEMTLVGARPILPEQRTNYGPAFEAYTLAPPGLTGLWQVSGRSRLSFLARVEWDERYRQSCSLSLDLRILLRTIVVVATRDGAW
jgi:lipopolysaccharide/colanic/teichoic acid biosynthesis glycosyltransferase